MEHAVANAHCSFFQPSFFFTVLGLEPSPCVLSEHFATEPPALSTLFLLVTLLQKGFQEPKDLLASPAANLTL